MDKLRTTALANSTHPGHDHAMPAASISSIDVVEASGQLARLHDEWARIDSRSGVAQWPSMIGALVAARSRIVAQGAWTAGPATLIDVLDLTRNEVSQCRVLRWLLDPLAHHGLGAQLVAALAVEYACSGVYS